MKKRVLSFLMLGAMAVSLTACGQKGTVAEQEPAAAEETRQEETAGENTLYEATLEEIEALLGMEDAETAELLGGGEENWTEDKSFYIGRMYEISLYGETYPVYTSCTDKKIVNSVSVWLANGEREISDEETEQWVQRLTELTGEEAAYDETTSEAGTKKWKWVSEDRIISLMRTDELLSISMNPAAGELGEAKSNPLTVYVPNEYADGFVVTEETITDFTAEMITGKLVEKNVLPEGTAVNSFEIIEGDDGRQLKLDLNASFLEKLNSMGTSGEFMIMGSVVNTFLTAYEAESIIITVDGKAPESGHCIYDEPLGFYETGEGEQ